MPLIKSSVYQKSAMAVPWQNAVADLHTTATTQRWRSGFYMAARSSRFPRNVVSRRIGKNGKSSSSLCAEDQLVQAHRARRRCVRGGIVCAAAQCLRWSTRQKIDVCVAAADRDERDKGG